MGETYDGTLNDINGFHVHPEHLVAALDAARDGPVPEGNVGGGTGMICHEFKGGTGTASRRLPDASGGCTVGALVQANYGRRERLTVDGVPVGREIPKTEVSSPWTPRPRASRRASRRSRPGAARSSRSSRRTRRCLPHQCERLAKRAGPGHRARGRRGRALERRHLPGVLHREPRSAQELQDRGGPAAGAGDDASDGIISDLFWAAIEATEEAILNALVSAGTMTGRDGITAHALDHDRLSRS